MVETIIQFVTNHSEALIAGSFSVILVLSGVMIYFNVFVIKPVDSEADFVKIEASIEKLLSKAEFMKTGSAAAGASGSTDAATSGGESGEPIVTSAELLELEADLAEKKREIEKLKEQVESGVGDVVGADDNTPELLSKIKNLEDRLAEYEIIEDDIADLSQYKEENAQLKKQLKEAGAAPPAEETSAEEMPAEVPPAEEVITAKAESEPEFPVQTEAADEAADAAVAAAVEAIDADDSESAPVEAFSKAVEDLEAQKEEASVSAEESEPAAEADAEAPKEEGSDDVFAEMSDSGDNSDDPLAALGDIDTNKMLEEIQGLEADANASAEVLEEQTDIDKMATEAQGLEKKS